MSEVGGEGRGGGGGRTCMTYGQGGLFCCFPAENLTASLGNPNTISGNLLRQSHGIFDQYHGLLRAISRPLPESLLLQVISRPLWAISWPCHSSKGHLRSYMQSKFYSNGHFTQSDGLFSITLGNINAISDKP
jgi:hypothetical protein